MEKKLIGRKLYLKWGSKTNPNVIIAIEKIVDDIKKNAEIDLVNPEGLMLCNIYENEKGEKIEENLGAPALNSHGYQIDYFFTEPRFWKTPGEEADGI